MSSVPRVCTLVLFILEAVCRSPLTTVPAISILPRYNERGNLEVQLFNIQTKLRAAKHRTWYPPEGKLVSDINKVCWTACVYVCGGGGGGGRGEGLGVGGWVSVHEYQ